MDQPPKTLTYTPPSSQQQLPSQARHTTCNMSTSPQTHLLDTPFPETDLIHASDASHDDDIIRVASYHRHDLDQAVIHCNPASLASSVFKSFCRDSVSSLGLLEALPLELLTAVCLRLDLQSALCFSHANSRAKDIIASTYQYRRVREHAQQVLRAAFHTDQAPNLGISDLHSALVTKACSLCSNGFGRFFYLLTATQCCLSCLESAPEFGVVNLGTVCTVTGRSRDSVRRLVPVLGTVPGIYGLFSAKRIDRRYYASRTHCSEILGVDFPDPWAHIRCDLYPRFWRRFLTSSSISYLDVATGAVERGLTCKGCQILAQAHYGPLLPKPWGAVYSRQGFLEHFRVCDAARELWVASKGGTTAFKGPFAAGIGRFLLGADPEPLWGEHDV